MSYRALFVLLLLGGCSEVPAAPDTAACVMHPVAILQTLFAHTLPVVVVGIDGHPAAMVVDTGATDSLLNDSFVRRTGLSRHASLRSFTGIGGEVENGDVTVPSFTLGYATARDVTFGDAGDIHIMQPNGAPVDGLLGGDILSNYDVLLDLSKQRVEIYDAAHCGAGFKPFGDHGFSGILGRAANRAVIVGELDGRRLPFLIDSGAPISYITRRIARRLGADLSHDLVVPSRGVGQSSTPTAIHRFTTLVIGPEHFSNPLIAVFEGPVNIIGDDILAANRVLLSYQAGRIFIEPTSPAFHRMPAAGANAAPGQTQAVTAGSDRG